MRRDEIDEDRLEAAIRALAEPLAEPLGVEVLTVDVKGHTGRRLVRVTADAVELDAQDGVDIDTLAQLSRSLARVLDEQDPIPGGYNLEVTSPGADRPLRRPRDFARNVGREVRIEPRADMRVTAEAEAAADDLSGIVVAVTETELTLERDGAEVVVPFGDIDHGAVVLPW